MTKQPPPTSSDGVPTAPQQPPADHKQPSSDPGQPPADHGQPPADHGLPSPDHRQPSGDHGLPPSGAHGTVPSLVLFVTASWAPTCRPSLSVARELGRKYAERTRLLTIEDPSDDEIDLLAVDMLPCWIAVTGSDRATPEPPESAPDGEPESFAAVERPSLAAVVAAPEWEHREVLVGAHPKHAVDSHIFGAAPLR